MTSRAPLAPLPLSLFHPSASSSSSSAHPPPSPVSLPLKRPLPPPSPSSSSHTPRHVPNSPLKPSSFSGVKLRKVSSTNPADGTETVRRKKVITPKEREVLERDELGVGRSPARRLFVDQLPIASPSASSSMGGIKGAVHISTPPIIAGPSRLQPSPPIIDLPSSSSSIAAATTSYFPETSSSALDENGATRPTHDPGFVVLPDTTAGPSTVNGLSTPRSKRSLPQSQPTLAPDAYLHVAVSPASSTRSSAYDENQENIPPPASAGVPGTPSRKGKGGVGTPSRLGRSSVCATSGTGTGEETRKRKALVAKLEAQAEAEGEGEGEGPDELTPGRAVVGKGKGRVWLEKEVDEGL